MWPQKPGRNSLQTSRVAFVWLKGLGKSSVVSHRDGGSTVPLPITTLGPSHQSPQLYPHYPVGHHREHIITENNLFFFIKLRTFALFSDLVSGCSPDQSHHTGKGGKHWVKLQLRHQGGESVTAALLAQPTLGVPRAWHKSRVQGTWVRDVTDQNGSETDVTCSSDTPNPQFTTAIWSELIWGV